MLLVKDVLAEMNILTKEGEKRTEAYSETFKELLIKVDKLNNLSVPTEVDILIRQYIAKRVAMEQLELNVFIEYVNKRLEGLNSLVIKD